MTAASGRIPRPSPRYLSLAPSYLCPPYLFSSVFCSCADLDPRGSRSAPAAICSPRAPRTAHTVWGYAAYAPLRPRITPRARRPGLRCLRACCLRDYRRRPRTDSPSPPQESISPPPSGIFATCPTPPSGT
jgi:hypothetical protein